MNEQDAKKRIDELVKLLNYHSQLYYVEDRNEITDYEYDMLQQELKGLEEQFPQFIRSDSPTQRVGGKAISIFEKVTHRVQMGSLQDVFSFEQVRSFIETVQQAVDKPQFVVEPKIDGLSVSLEYHNGELAIGSTRGDGFVGEDVTSNLKTVKSIPIKINEELPLIEVRGETFLGIYVSPLTSYQRQFLIYFYRNGLYSFQIRSNVLAHKAVTTGRTYGKLTVMIFKGYRKSVYFRLNNELRFIHSLLNCLNKASHLFKGKNVLQRTHLHTVCDFLKY